MTDKEITESEKYFAGQEERQKQILLENEERLRLVLDGANVSFWDWNIITGEIHRNEQWARMLGYACAEAGSNPGLWKEFIHPDDREMVCRAIKEHLAGSAAFYFAEFRMIARDGSIRWMQDRGMVTVRDEEGNALRMSGLQIDITQSKLNENKLKEYAEELKASNALKDRYFSIISHDLRGPFQGFLGLTKTLSESAESMERQEISEVASVIYQSAKETFALLTNLHEWSKLQTGRFIFYPIELNLFLEVENIEKLFQSAALNKSIDMQNNVDRKIFIRSDEQALSTILRNLIDNAVKFTAHEGTVSVSASLRCNLVEISIADSGPSSGNKLSGVISNLGTGFTPGRGSSGKKGSGLGLPLCSELIKKCGGTLNVRESNLGGTEFFFTLPAGFVEEDSKNGS
ncbi:MAG: PAS domain-containing protein [Ignavibacteria bacterium]|jgi:PAS domain S-box-containing protein|nr:PAS domain-containing protein [Ignavibacteria bacterium]MCU7504145.1 PAS domain-containing protein [Ignavibacteria bacterium]MCU7516405.1 PAS domain-containing protein [Ignavibacteria bacterium]